MFRQDIRNITAICVAKGVEFAVISPGSRNTPLTLAFTTQKEIKCIPVTDERSAGFFALGIAQRKRVPVALICTSGSAVLNFAPSIVEAYYQNLPIIVLTADRPGEWIDQADGQTIRQDGIYANYIKQGFKLPSDRDEDSTWLSDRLVSQAIDLAVQFPMGPVHINVPLKEPLYTAIPENPLLGNIPETLPFSNSPDEAQFARLHQVWNTTARKLIVVGMHEPNKELNALMHELSFRNDCVVVADNLSNVSGEKIIENPDLWLGGMSEEEKKSMIPDLLVTVGQSVISKQLKLFLRSSKEMEHWQVEATLPYADTYQSLQWILQMRAVELFNSLNSHAQMIDESTKEILGNNQIADPEDVIRLSENQLNKNTHLSEESSRNYALRANFLNKRAQERFRNYVEGLQHCDMRSMDLILQHIPDDYILQISNSTPIRLSQLYTSRKELSYYCNRGTSGIEGSVSTAAGAAFAQKENTLLITGDLSFVYDSNGLWNRYNQGNLKIILLNNGGANIFRIIGDPQTMESCQEFFDSPNTVDIGHLCQAYGATHQLVKDEKELKVALRDFFAKNNKVSVLEIKTEMSINTNSFKQLFKAIKQI